jgi:hypothetical protein
LITITTKLVAQWSPYNGEKTDFTTKDVKSTKFGQNFFLKNLASLRLCERFSEFRLWLRRAGIFVVSEFEVISTLTYTAGFKTVSGGGK